VGPPWATTAAESGWSLALPERCRWLCKQRAQQAADRLAASERQETWLVFTTAAGTEMDPANVRRELRRALALVPGLNPDAATTAAPRIWVMIAIACSLFS
jgi:hypothetical protein